ncbi:hypothetical protein F66182_2109 [Fusarium sp. NRRL 66182]|nr:hypothetical protein F66182_2109 [Fusarium sp. NRRL 66182]
MANPPRFTLLWTGAIALLHFTLFVCGSALSSSADAPLKAALVSLVNEGDLPATLFSIEQVEDKFNNRYLYDWIFFSVQELGNEFKELTSNATNATCIFEVIPHENWSVPGLVDQPQVPTSQETNSDYDSETLRPIASLPQINRWNSAPFAKERRLQDYEWFWRVEPGDEAAHHHGTQDEYESTSWLNEGFASWLSDIYGSSLYPTFEIGSLAFFRSPHHVAFFDHLDSAGDFQYRRVDDVPVHSLSASMFLPSQSVWNFRTKEKQLRGRQSYGPDKLQPTADVNKRLNDDDNSESTSSDKWEHDIQEVKKAMIAAWDAMAEDLGRQSEDPRLISGNTWKGAASD